MKFRRGPAPDRMLGSICFPLQPGRPGIFIKQKDIYRTANSTRRRDDLCSVGRRVNQVNGSLPRFGNRNEFNFLWIQNEFGKGIQKLASRGVNVLFDKSSF